MVISVLVGATVVRVTSACEILIASVDGQAARTGDDAVNFRTASAGASRDRQVEAIVSNCAGVARVKGTIGAKVPKSPEARVFTGTDETQ